MRAPSAAVLALASPFSLAGMCAVGANGGLARPGTRVGLVAISAASRSFQVASSFGSGRQPIRPGWIRPAKFTPGMWRDEVYMPLMSQIDFCASGK